METVTVRELRNTGGAVIDRVIHGARLVVTRDGADVAELRPVGRPPLSAAELVARRRTLPAVDAERLRRDLDEILDPTL
jgi:antitoxin (DNA-binding transcriptional repressor) of toxin-antitoxin stability system